MGGEGNRDFGRFGRHFVRNRFLRRNVPRFSQSPGFPAGEAFTIPDAFIPARNNPGTL